MSINLKKIQAPIQKKDSSIGDNSRSLINILNSDIQLFGTGLNWQTKEAFYSEMTVLLRAGLDIKSSLEIVLDNQDNKKTSIVFQQLYSALIAGAGLAMSMEKTGKFSTYELSSIKIAEESGKLLPVLEKLSIHFAKNIQLKRLLVSALSYPVLVILVSGGALLFLLNFLVPLFGDIYKRLNQELPDITKVIIGFSEALGKYSPAISLSIIILSALIFYFRKSTFIKKWSSSLIVRLPLFGQLIKKIYLSRFCHGMSFLLGSSVPLTKSLELSSSMVDYYPISSVLGGIRHKVIQGESLHNCLKQESVFPNKMVALLKIGEETNHLPQILQKLAEQYDAEVEQKTKILGSLLEPILIVFLAITVGIVLVAMYLPIFKLVTNFGI